LWLGNGVGVLLVFDGLLAGLGGQFEAHVSTLFGPFVGLLGQDRTDEADDRGPVGEDPDDVGAAADLLVEPLLCYLQVWRQVVCGKSVNANRSSRVSSKCDAASGYLAAMVSITRENWARTSAASGWS